MPTLIRITSGGRAQRENIAKRKKWGEHGGRFIPLPAIVVPSTSWWANVKTDAEFTLAHLAQLSRITNVQARTVYRLRSDSD